MKNAFGVAGIFPFNTDNVRCSKQVTFLKKSSDEPMVTTATDTSEFLMQKIEKQLEPEVLSALKTLGKEILHEMWSKLKNISVSINRQPITHRD